MSKIFLKINVKFYSNVITHNQTNEYETHDNPNVNMLIYLLKVF